MAARWFYAQFDDVTAPRVYSAKKNRRKPASKEASLACHSVIILAAPCARGLYGVYIVILLHSLPAGCTACFQFNCVTAWKSPFKVLLLLNHVNDNSMIVSL